MMILVKYWPQFEQSVFLKVFMLSIECMHNTIAINPSNYV